MFFNKVSNKRGRCKVYNPPPPWFRGLIYMYYFCTENIFVLLIEPRVTEQSEIHAQRGGSDSTLKRKVTKLYFCNIFALMKKHKKSMLQKSVHQVKQDMISRKIYVYMFNNITSILRKYCTFYSSILYKTL